MEKEKNNKEILKKIEQLRKEIERIKEEINKLYEQLSSTDDIEYIFNELKNVTHGQLNTIICVFDNDVKYITRKQESGFGVLIISYKDKKGYLLEDYNFDPKENVIEIGFYEKYEIPGEVLDKLRDVKESNIDYAVAPLFRLYYLMKKYPVNFVKVKYN